MTVKINKNALYFRQAAVMLGEAEAERHLQIVIDNLAYPENWGFSKEDSELLNLFVWYGTPQGEAFWDLIDCVACEEGLAK